MLVFGKPYHLLPAVSDGLMYMRFEPLDSVGLTYSVGTMVGSMFIGIMTVLKFALLLESVTFVFHLLSAGSR
jgi:hypothetical protein